MSSPLDPIWIPRVDPVTSPLHVKRRRDRKDEPGGNHSDEPREDGEEPEEDGTHVDVLA